MPPAFRRMFTPAMFFDTPSSRSVTWRVQPPLSCRTCASAKENRRLGSVPWSVEGGFSMSGLACSRARLRGPGSLPPVPGFRLGINSAAAATRALSNVPVPSVNPVSTSRRLDDVNKPSQTYFKSQRPSHRCFRILLMTLLRPARAGPKWPLCPALQVRGIEVRGHVKRAKQPRPLKPRIDFVIGAQQPARLRLTVIPRLPCTA